MGLLEYQVMPSLHDDRWLCTFAIQQRWKFHQLAAGQLGTVRYNRYGTEKADITAHPSCTKSHLPGHFSPDLRVGPAL
jgi:hypothetical protein